MNFSDKIQVKCPYCGANNIKFDVYYNISLLESSYPEICWYCKKTFELVIKYFRGKIIKVDFYKL